MACLTQWQCPSTPQQSSPRRMPGGHLGARGPSTPQQCNLSYHRDQWPIIQAQSVDAPTYGPPAGRQPQRAPSQVVCRRCGGVGHIARNCASRPRQDNAVRFQCGCPGYFQAQCSGNGRQ
ncbi:hypothetical protein MRX96_025918 [Rhipicephalus microplus]